MMVFCNACSAVAFKWSQIPGKQEEPEPSLADDEIHCKSMNSTKKMKQSMLFRVETSRTQQKRDTSPRLVLCLTHPASADSPEEDCRILAPGACAETCARKTSSGN